MNKTQAQQQTADIRQVELLSSAFQSAEKNRAYWLNVSQSQQPRIYTSDMKSANCSSFNSLILSLHSAENGYKTPLYISFADAKKRGNGVLTGQRGVPINWFICQSYSNRKNPEEVIDRKEYLALNEEDRKQFKGIPKRQTLTLFNLEQTAFPKHEKETFSKFIKENGAASEPVEQQKVPNEIRDAVSNLEKSVNDNLVKVQHYPDSRDQYNIGADEISLPNINQYHNYSDYVQDLLRQAVSATGREQRLNREGASMSATPTMVKYENLVVEVASAIKMQELGLPARLDTKTLDMVEYWVQELHDNPRMLRALEADVNASLAVIKKAERGEKIDYNIYRNEDATLRPPVLFRHKETSSRDCAILTDILAHGGMMIADGNFTDEKDKKTFLNKYGLEYYDKCLKESLEMTMTDDSDLIEEGYTQAQINALGVSYICQSALANGWSDKGKFNIIQVLSNLPNAESGDMVVVWDKENAIADVILPKGALSGGMVEYQNGDKRPYYLTPDEVMSEEDRTQKFAKVIPNEPELFNKEKIISSIVTESQNENTYVRFFNTTGSLGFLPDNTYFAGKTVSIAKLIDDKLKVTEEIDVSTVVAKALDVKRPQFKRIQMIRDDVGHWQLYLHPKDAEGYCVYPSKEDVNRFFVPLKQEDSAKVAEVSQELAEKYYAISEKDPTIKTELFAGVSDEDVTRINKTNIFRTKDDQLKIIATIDGDRHDVRDVTQSQWQRLWLNDDIKAAKNKLAALIYKDILHPKQEVEELQQQEEQQVEGVSNSQRIAVAKQFAEIKQQPIFIMPNEEILYFQYNSETDNIEVGGVTNVGMSVIHTFPYDHDFSLDENLQGTFEQLSEMEEYQSREVEEDQEEAETEIRGFHR